MAGLGLNNKIWGLVIGFTLIASAIVLFYYSGQIDSYQYIQLLLSASFLFTSVLGLLASIRQETSSKLQAEAARDSIRASVAPSLLFRIRPANDYWSGSYGRQPVSWEPGVGIYIENIGVGNARDIRLSYKAVGDIEEQRCEAEFSRLRVGEIYTLPSRLYPQLEVKKTHQVIVIESVEYDDIRTPPNHYTIDEPIILDLNPDFFDDRDRLKGDPLGPKEA